jgi:Ca2+-binding RTX toxin-like protein
MRTLLATTVATLALAGSAWAAHGDASYTASGGLLIADNPGTSSDIGVFGQEVGGTFNYVVDAIGSDPTAGAGCSRTADGHDSCAVGTGSRLITVRLEGGDDSLNEEFGAAICVYGQALGDEFVSAGDGADLIDGGPGFDLLNGDAGDDLLNGCDGNDTLNGGDGADRLNGGLGNDTVNGGAGNDRFQPKVGEGSDVFSGGAGEDTLVYPADSPSLAVSLDNVANDGKVLTDLSNVKSDIENVTGGGGTNTLTGSSSPNTLTGGPKPDVLEGGLGADHLIGNAGNDLLKGGPGVDNLEGGLGADQLSGGPDGDFLQMRDGEPERASSCGDGVDFISIDLRDTAPPDCEQIDQGAVDEGPNVGISTGTLKVDRQGRATVKLTCPRKVKRCAGRLSLELFHGQAARSAAGGTRYAIRKGRSKLVAVHLSRADRSALSHTRKPRGRIESVERGDHGPKTTIRVVRLGH